MLKIFCKDILPTSDVMGSRTRLPKEQKHLQIFAHDISFPHLWYNSSYMHTFLPKYRRVPALSNVCLIK